MFRNHQGHPWPPVTPFLKPGLMYKIQVFSTFLRLRRPGSRFTDIVQTLKDINQPVLSLILAILCLLQNFPLFCAISCAIRHFKNSKTLCS